MIGRLFPLWGDHSPQKSQHLDHRPGSEKDIEVRASARGLGARMSRHRQQRWFEKQRREPSLKAELRAGIGRVGMGLSRQE